MPAKILNWPTKSATGEGPRATITNETAADVITPLQARTLDGLLRERVRRSPQRTAYRYFDHDADEWRDLTWAQMAAEVGRWQRALAMSGLQPGERVGILARNSAQWIMMDQAALGLHLIVVPLYYNDRPDNIAYILRDARVRLLLIESDEQWRALAPRLGELDSLERLISIQRIDADTLGTAPMWLEDWLPKEPETLRLSEGNPDAVATLVYTSGTTGPPKGVMLSHRNIVWNAYAGLQSIMVYPNDLFLSFLPLSHTLERTVGYYLPMMAGATVAFNRSIPQIADDLRELHPTQLVAVPRIFERIHAKIHAELGNKSAAARNLFRLTCELGWEHSRSGSGGWRAHLWPLLNRWVAARVREQLGGRLRCVICGGAPLPYGVARALIGCGIPIQQGYGLTEASPVVSVNTFEHNYPDSVGPPLQDVEVRIGDNRELLVRSPGVMLGYWNDHNATYAAVDHEGWLHTGDQARLENGCIYITGRLKEIVVLANGEKAAPADLEIALGAEPLFEQVMVLGDGRPYLTALIVLDPEHWRRMAKVLALDPDDPASLEDEKLQNMVLNRIGHRLARFPGTAKIYRAGLLLEPWTVENELLTPTLKLRRAKVRERYADLIENLYAGHTSVTGAESAGA